MRLFIVRTITVIGVALIAAGGPGHSTAQEPSPVTSTIALPASPAGNQLAWLIALLNGDEASPTEMSVAAHFTPAALVALPPSMLLGRVQQFAAAFGPFSYQGPARPETANQIVGYLTGRAGDSFIVVVATENAAPNRLTGAAVLPVAPQADLPDMAPESVSGSFDVGGRTLFLSCSGTGSPTVILEAGYGDSGGLWAPIQNGIAPLTRICTYDRPNVSAGASDPAPTPRTSADQVADLRALLTAAQIPGPYVLVAHSYGGLIARLYATTYPSEVVGMVLIDTVHEDRVLRRQAMVSPAQWAVMKELEADFSDFEQIDQETSWRHVRDAQAATPLPPMPLLVLAAGRIDPAFLPANWPLAEEEALHQELQAALAALSPDGEYVLVEESGHYIQLEQPALVIASVTTMIEAVRDPTDRATPEDARAAST